MSRSRHRPLRSSAGLTLGQPRDPAVYQYTRFHWRFDIEDTADSLRSIDGLFDHQVRSMMPRRNGVEQVLEELETPLELPVGWKIRADLEASDRLVKIIEV